jgi:hypothetical protein
MRRNVGGVALAVALNYVVLHFQSFPILLPGNALQVLVIIHRESVLRISLPSFGHDGELVACELDKCLVDHCVCERIEIFLVLSVALRRTVRSAVCTFLTTRGNAGSTAR